MRSKYLAPLLIALLFIFVGCDKKDIVSPDVSGSESDFTTVSEPNWLVLPEKSENGQFGESTVTKFVQAERREFVTVS